MLMPISMKPEGDDRLRIEWNDGKTGVIPWRTLRDHCPCAACREERLQPPNPFRVINLKDIPVGPLRPVAMTPVGYYAYKIVWNDGHDTGIMPLDQLRALCQWEEPSVS